VRVGILGEYGLAGRSRYAGFLGADRARIHAHSS
jgi:hypothetical protein